MSTTNCLHGPSGLSGRVSRRRVLEAMGVSLAVAPFVPLLESAAGGPETPPKRFVMMMHPHGVYRPAWLPSGGGKAFQLSPILAPLAAHQQRLVVIDGLDVYPGGPPGGAHTVGPAYVFTGSPMLEGDDFQHPDSGGPHGWNSHASVDQAIAQSIGNDTPFQSLVIGVQTGGAHPGSRISYAGPAQPLTPEADPQALFTNLFGPAGVDTHTAAKLKAERLSVIDTVKPQLDTLQPKVSQGDRMKVEAHLDAIRDMEMQLSSDFTCSQPEIGDPVDPYPEINIETVSQQHLQLLAQAFACQGTNVASIMYRRGENDGFPYPHLGIDTEHHLTTHAGDTDAASWGMVTTIETWYAEQLAFLADLLAGVTEPDGSSVLDNTLVMWGSEIAKGNNHAWTQMPFVLLGSGGGAVDTGQFITTPAGTNHCRLLVTLCNAMGVDVDTFGGFDDGTGPLPGLLL